MLVEVAALLEERSQRIALGAEGDGVVGGGQEEVDLAGTVYMHDTTTGETNLVSRDDNGIPANGPARHPSMSDDGQFVVFVSDASNLVPADGNGRSDVFVRDRSANTIARVSVGAEEGDGGSFDGAISGDGRFVVFSSKATNLKSA